MDKLPEDFKKKWLEALRSGKYIQGYEHLYSGDRYCCLGVACAVVGMEIKEPYYFIPKDAMKVPDIIRDKNLITQKLSYMNDLGKMNFIEIADWIEKNL